MTWIASVIGLAVIVLLAYKYVKLSERYDRQQGTYDAYFDEWHETGRECTKLRLDNRDLKLENRVLINKLEELKWLRLN